MRRHARFHRIQVNIPAGLQEIIIRPHQTGLISPLEHMPAVAVMTVIVHRIFPRKMHHKLPNFDFSRLYQQVKMIGHQTVCMHMTAMIQLLLLHDLQEHLKIEFVFKNLHSADSTRHQMIRRTGKPLSTLSGYGIEVLLKSKFLREQMYAKARLTGYQSKNHPSDGFRRRIFNITRF